MPPGGPSPHAEPARRRAGGRTSSTGSTTRATGSSSSPTSTPPDFRVVTAPCDTPASARGSTWWPTRPAAGSPGRRLSSGAWSSTSGTTASKRSTSSFARRQRAHRPPSTSPSTPSARHEPEYHTPTLRFEYESLVTPPLGLRGGRRPGERQLLKQMRCSPASTPPTTSRRGVGEGPRRHAGPGGRRVARTRRSTAPPAVALRLRRLRVLAPAVVLDRPAVAARPGRRLGPRPPPWGGELGRRGTSTASSSQAQHLHRLHRLRRAPRGRGYRSPDRVTSAAAAPAACWSAPASPCGPTCSRGVVAEVPFVDVVTTMRDPSLPLTVGE